MIDHYIIANFTIEQVKEWLEAPDPSTPPMNFVQETLVNVLKVAMHDAIEDNKTQRIQIEVKP